MTRPTEIGRPARGRRPPGTGAGEKSGPPLAPRVDGGPPRAGPERWHGGTSMRRTQAWRATALDIAAAALIPAGAANKKSNAPDPKIDETVATVATILGNTIKVEGVGL